MGQAETYLDQIPMWTRKKNSLKDVRTCLHSLGDPDREIPAIHVAGTNGKGSVCAFLTSMLIENGRRVGTFTSPHLTEVRERFLINGQLADPEAFERAFVKVQDMTRRMMAQGYCHPTFFEFLFYMAMVLFKEQRVDVMVIETGLGGRLDTTNVLEQPLASVITSISLDHTAYLGDTIEKIAGEKSGIIKNKVPVIADTSSPAAAEVIEKRARLCASPFYPVGEKDIQIEGFEAGCIKAEAQKMDGSRLPLFIPFEASYQAANAMLAVRTLEVLGLALDEAVMEGIKKTRWSGRMEQVRPGLYLDGAHNPGGIRAFLKTAGEIRARTGKKAFLLFAAVSDKDYREMAGELCRGLSWSRIGVVHISSERGLPARQLLEVFEQAADVPVCSFEDTREALSAMRKKAEGELLFCAGSLYLIGELKSILDE